MHFLFVLLLLLPTVASANCIELIEFEIEDQFKEKHTREELLGTTAVLVWADRDGSDFLDAWNAALDIALEGRDVQRRALAHVKGVPGWIPGLKGKIRGRFSEDPAEWALLDWKGRFAEAYARTENTVNVFVFSPEGCLLGRVAGDEPEPVLIEALLEMLPETAE
jgi:hypothetical protein